ncbi:MAG: hypothetical protein KA753_09610, partial [Paludibacter sp.]|nr:hypothetical protein [Paludibacter sp.]
MNNGNIIMMAAPMEEAVEDTEIDTTTIHRPGTVAELNILKLLPFVYITRDNRYEMKEGLREYVNIEGCDAGRDA